MNILLVFIYCALLNSFGECIKGRPTSKPLIKTKRPGQSSKKTTRKSKTTTKTTTRGTGTTDEFTFTWDTPDLDSSEELTTPKMPAESSEVDTGDSADMAQNFFDREPATCYSEAIHELWAAAGEVLLALDNCPEKVKNSRHIRKGAQNIRIAAKNAYDPCTKDDGGFLMDAKCFVVATVAMIKLIIIGNKESEKLTFQHHPRDPKNFNCIHNPVFILSCKIIMLVGEIAFCAIKFAVELIDSTPKLSKIMKEKKAAAKEVPAVEETLD